MQTNRGELSEGKLVLIYNGLLVGVGKKKKESSISAWVGISAVEDLVEMKWWILA